MKKIMLVIYCALILIPCAFFSLGMMIPGAANTSSSAEGVEMPKLLTEEQGVSINSKFGLEFEKYFAKSFAYRNKVVDIFSAIKTAVFSEGNDQVVIGKDGFLFFGETLDDYMGRSRMSDEDINIAADFLLELYNESTRKGAKFLFVCAPNKNSIYPEMMPSRYIMNTDGRNLDRLYSALDERGVPYLDLRPILIEAKNEQLVYHKRDTHWNAEGARIAIEAIADKLSMPIDDFSEYGKVEVTDFPGDLDALLFPEREMYDNNTEYNFGGKFTFKKAYSNMMANEIIANGTDGTGKLIMFRDSFANAMIPFFASVTETSTFSRSTPYSLDNYDTADYVIVQIAERYINTLKPSDDPTTNTANKE
ncbi:MAG: hypothetical protein IJY93_08510 [Clostridia bacterium]|nr:hypothetical protein [Clostridia bacterium]